MAVIVHCQLFFLLCVILSIFLCCNCAERKINSKTYNCLKGKDNITILYITATDEDKNNMVHFIWSVYDTPSIIVGYTSKFNFQHHPHFAINCSKLISEKPQGAITWQYDYVSAFEVSEIQELHDPKDNVIFDKSDFGKTIKHGLDGVEWKTAKVNKKEVTFEGEFLGGKIVIMLNSSSEDGRGSEAPRQLYSNNGTRFSITLNKLKFNTTNTRVALKLLTHTSKKYSGQTSKIMEDRSIDDEFSPGVFRTFVASTVFNSTLASFVSWKPVAYAKETKSLTDELPSYQYNYRGGTDDYERYTSTESTPLVSNSKETPSSVIQAAIYVDKSYPTMISYGQKKDGWYEKKKYLIWSGQVGYGKPQFDILSKTLIITIFVGLGLPFAFILAGSFYVCFKKYRERKTTSSYGKIN